MNAPPEVPQSDWSPDPVHPRSRRWTLIALKVAFLLTTLLVIIGYAVPFYLKSSCVLRSETDLVLARQIEQAVNSYYTDNQVMPAPAGIQATDGGNLFITDTPGGLEIINTLAGLAQNSRKVKYLSLREGKNKKGGAIYNSSGTRIEGLFDTWGNPFFIVMDTSYEERVLVPLRVPVLLNGRRAAVYSAGPDGILETKDDIKTWSP